jgi:hypothetical protein
MEIVSTHTPAPLDEEESTEDQSIESIRVQRFGIVRGLWFIFLSGSCISLLCLSLLFPKWVTLSLPYQDDNMKLYGHIQYDFDLKGIDVTGVYNGISQNSYIAFSDLDSKFSAKSSALGTSVLVICAAVVQGIGVLMYRSTRVRVEGKDSKARIILHLLVLISWILELCAILAYHLGNLFLVQLRERAEKVTMDSGSVMIIVTLVLDIFKASCFFYNLNTSPVDLAIGVKQALLGIANKCKRNSGRG